MIALLSGLAVSLVSFLPWQEEGWSREEARQIEDVQRALAAGKYQDALSTLDELKESRPDTGLLARLTGHALAGLGRETEAREAFVRALGTGQFTADVFAKLLELDQDAQRPAPMLVETALLAMFLPDDPRWKRTLADLLAANELDDAALVTYTELLGLPGATPELALRVGRMHARAGRAGEALAWLETAWYAGAKDQDLPRLMASLWQQQGDLERAAIWSGRSTQGGDAFREHLRRAELLLASGDAARAQEPARAALESPDAGVQARASVLLGHIAHQGGDGEAALASFRRALELGESDAQVQVYVARTLLERGDTAGALPFLDALLARGIEDRPTLEAAIRALVRSADDDARLGGLLTRYLELYGPDERVDRWIAELAKRRRA